MSIWRGEPVPVRDRHLAPPRAQPHMARPLAEWQTRPRILVTNDDGIESRGLLTLKQALEPLGDVYVLAPDTNQSAVGHTKTFMRPLRVRERTLADGTRGYSVDGSPTDAVSLALLGYFDDRLRPGRGRASTTAPTWATTSPTRARSAARWRRCSRPCLPSPSRRSTTSIPTSRSPALIARRRRSQHPRERPRSGRADQHQRARHHGHGVPGGRGDAPWQARLPGRARSRGSTRAARPTTGWAARRRPVWPSPVRTLTRSVNKRVAITPIQLDLTARRLLSRLRSWSWDLDARRATTTASSRAR